MGHSGGGCRGGAGVLPAVWAEPWAGDGVRRISRAVNATLATCGEPTPCSWSRGRLRHCWRI